MPNALITGITGQDGSYLAEFLLAKGYNVFGMVRRLSQNNYDRIAHILDDVTLLHGDLLDQSSLTLALEKAQPDEVYNLAAMSHVGISFEQPAATGEYNGLGVARLLEAIRLTNPWAKFYQASTSELFGVAVQTPQTEKTPFCPRSPYGTAKLYAHWTTVNYRESYNLHASCGILFNHESPRRGVDFVTKKIARGVARIKYGLDTHITLGNLDAYRDWGFAGDYVEAMWLMLQQPTPGDYVIATGETHSVGEFVDRACEYAGLPLPGHQYVKVDERFTRPADVPLLIGDPSKAARVLGWTPRVRFPELVASMIDHEMRQLYEAQSPTHSHSDSTGYRRLSPVQEIRQARRLTA